MQGSNTIRLDYNNSIVLTDTTCYKIPKNGCLFIEVSSWTGRSSFKINNSPWMGIGYQNNSNSDTHINSILMPVLKDDIIQFTRSGSWGNELIFYPYK